MWEKKEAEHYVFHYRKNSFAEKNIEDVTNLQENCYDYITSVLRVRMKRKIKYFLCDSPEEVGELYGDNEPANGAVKYPNEVYAVYNEKIKCVGPHEDAHIISYNTLAKPVQALLYEGLAMFFDEVWLGIPNNAWVSVFIENGLYRSLSLLKEREEFYRFSETITYPLSGVFVRYLISVFGVEKFKKFYKAVNEDFDKNFSEIFGMSLDQFENKMIGYAGNIKYNGNIYETIENYLKREGLIR